MLFVFCDWACSPFPGEAGLFILSFSRNKTVLDILIVIPQLE